MADAPWPLIEVAAAPVSGADGKELLGQLVANRLAGCTVRASADPTSGHITLGSTTEAELDAFVTHLRHAGIVFDFGAPQVVYRATITKRIVVDYTQKKEIGSSAQSARLNVAFEPNPRGAGNAFQNRIASSMPAEYVASIEKGIASALDEGVIGDSPVIDVAATLLESAWHETDSSPQAFEAAAHDATREALRSVTAVLLEPIMAVEVVTPEDFAGSVIGDLRSRRGQVRDKRTRGDDVVITASAPLVNLIGYPNQLRSFSRGRATYTMTFAEYRALPPRDDGPFPMAAARRA